MHTTVHTSTYISSYLYAYYPYAVGQDKRVRIAFNDRDLYATALTGTPADGHGGRAYGDIGRHVLR